MSIIPCKTVAVGDPATGKTSLLMVYASGEFPKEHVPTIFENYDAVVKSQDSTIRLTLWDTAGQEEYDQLRSISYPNAHFFLMVFAIDDRNSFENISQKWSGEIKKCINEGHAPHANLILVGTKSDKRKEKDVDLVEKSKAEALAKQIGVLKYFEVSALENIGIKELFGYICDNVYIPKPLKRRSGLFESHSSEDTEIDESLRKLHK